MLLIIATGVIGITLLLLNALLLTVTARLLKAPDATFMKGLCAVLMMAAISIFFVLVISVGLNRMSLSLSDIKELRILAAFLQISSSVFIMRMLFSLRIGRSIALFAMNLIWNGVAYLLAIFVYRPYIAEAYKMPTPSMSPTLMAGDRVLADKLLQPRRWDLVMYRPVIPGQPGNEDIYCKRLVGLPGERLRMQDGNLYINDQTMSVPAVLAGRFNMPPYSHLYKDGQTITLGNDELFLMGDNVSMSFDSRFVGPSKQSAVVGVAAVVYWPMTRMKMLR